MFTRITETHAFTKITPRLRHFFSFWVHIYYGDFANISHRGRLQSRWLLYGIASGKCVCLHIGKRPCSVFGDFKIPVA